MSIQVYQCKLVFVLLLITNLTFGQKRFYGGEYSDEPIADRSFKSRMADLEENILSEIEICDDCEIYRLTWLRSFDNPVCIKIERRVNSYKLTLKIGKGAAGYELEGLRRTKNIDITGQEWNYFETLIEGSGLDTIPNRFYFPMTDGATWTMEYKSAFEYKGHKTNLPDSIFMLPGLYLMELTDRDYHKPDDYSDYSRNRFFLNKKKEIVLKETIVQALINHLNNKLKSNPLKSGLCHFVDNIITINRKGKVTNVQTPREEGFWYFFEDWQCRNQLKRALKDFNLSSIDLKRKIKIYLTCSYDKVERRMYYSK